MHQEHKLGFNNIGNRPRMLSARMEPDNTLEAHPGPELRKVVQRVVCVRVCACVWSGGVKQCKKLEKENIKEIRKCAIWALGD